MQTIQLTTEIYVYSYKELKSEDKELLDKAIEALENAYAPFSRFRVGAALLLENGKIVTGSNQENASYTNGICAERVALFTAGNQFPGVAVLKVAVVGISEENDNAEPVTPCGSCRQTIIEMETRYNTPIKLILKGSGEKVFVVQQGNSLLPLAFNRKVDRKFKNNG